MAYETNITELSTQKVLFEKKRYAVQMIDSRFGSLSRESLEYEEREDFMLDALIKRLSMDVLCSPPVKKEYSEEKQIKFPASWWQHLKLDHFPEWFKKKWPVVYDIQNVKLNINVETVTMYPEANISLPGRFGSAYIYQDIKVV
jgi:hypothetical protein